MNEDDERILSERILGLVTEAYDTPAWDGSYKIEEYKFEVDEEDGYILKEHEADLGPDEVIFDSML